MRALNLPNAGQYHDFSNRYDASHLTPHRSHHPHRRRRGPAVRGAGQWVNAYSRLSPSPKLSPPTLATYASALAGLGRWGGSRPLNDSQLAAYLHSLTAGGRPPSAILITAAAVKHAARELAWPSPIGNLTAAAVTDARAARRAVNVQGVGG